MATKQVWRLEDSRGRGPFDGQGPSGALEDDEFEEFLADTVGKSKAIRATRDQGLLMFLVVEDRIRSLQRQFGRRPVFGAPDRDCFERWFPLRWREAYGRRGFQPAIYTVPEAAVAEGASVAEVIFVPIGPKEVLDPHTLAPLA